MSVNCYIDQRFRPIQYDCLSTPVINDCIQYHVNVCELTFLLINDCVKYNCLSTYLSIDKTIVSSVIILRFSCRFTFLIIIDCIQYNSSASYSYFYDDQRLYPVYFERQSTNLKFLLISDCIQYNLANDCPWTSTAVGPFTLITFNIMHLVSHCMCGYWKS